MYGHHEPYPCATGSCRVNGVYGHRQCTHLAVTELWKPSGNKSVVMICLEMYRSGLDESSTVHFLLDIALSPAGYWISRESALLYRSEQNQVPQGLPVSVPW